MKLFHNKLECIKRSLFCYFYTIQPYLSSCALKKNHGLLYSFVNHLTHLEIESAIYSHGHCFTVKKGYMHLVKYSA